MPPKRRIGKVGKGKGSAPKAAPKSKGRGGGKVNTVAVAAAVGKDEERPAVPKPKSAPRCNRVPAAGPPVKKTIVEKVPLEDGDMEGTLKKARRNKALRFFPGRYKHTLANRTRCPPVLSRRCIQDESGNARCRSRR
jgi:hypothetical protein